MIAAKSRVASARPCAPFRAAAPRPAARRVAANATASVSEVNSAPMLPACSAELDSVALDGAVNKQFRRRSAFSKPATLCYPVAQIVDKLKTLTLLEAAELVKEIETTFGVDAR